MNFSLSTSVILELFTDSIQACSGTVTETFHDQRHLFVRSLLPKVQESRPNDLMQAGIASRATEYEACIYPYLFREVCSNGAIMAATVDSHQIQLSHDMTRYEIHQQIQGAVYHCSDSSVFDRNMDQVRRSVDSQIDLAISLIGLMDHLPAAIWEVIFNRFEQDQPTRFSLMNAVTSVARDTEDQDLRWRLEELGGGIGAFVFPHPPADAHGMYVDQEAELRVARECT